jgi:hypothetical protein
LITAFLCVLRIASRSELTAAALSVGVLAGTMSGEAKEQDAPTVGFVDTHPGFVDGHALILPLASRPNCCCDWDWE